MFAMEDITVTEFVKKMLINCVNNNDERQQNLHEMPDIEISFILQVKTTSSPTMAESARAWRFQESEGKRRD